MDEARIIARPVKNNIMIFPEGKLKQFSGLVVASSTNEDGAINIRLDDSGTAAENRKKFFEKLEIQEKQTVHIVVSANNKISEIDKSGAKAESVDGAVTNRRGIFLTMMTADCIPLVVFDQTRGVIALVHVGWREVAMSLAKKTVNLMNKKFQSRPEDCLAWLGPGICEKCYQQSGWKAFLKKVVLSISRHNDVVSKSDGKFVFDLKKDIIRQLIDADVLMENIETANYCTVHDKNLFPSNFRERKSRQSSVLTVVGLR